MTTTTLTAKDFISATLRGDNMTIIDLRTQGEISTECLNNCIALPVQELNHQTLDKALVNHTEGAPVFLLCQTGKRAQMAVEKLADKKHLSLVILEGGLNAIKAAGAATNKGKKNVMCLERQVRIAAGSLVLIGVTLGFLVHANFFLIAGFVGAGLTFAGISDTCAMGMVLARMPWNQ